MIKFEVEYEITPLRNAYVCCINCKGRFNAMVNGKTESNGRIHDAVDLSYGVFKCPHCFEEFKTRGEEILIQGI